MSDPVADYYQSNLINAYSILAGIPSSRFVPALSAYYQLSNLMVLPVDWHSVNLMKKDMKAHSCGTLGCGAGWLTMHPDFPLRNVPKVFNPQGPNVESVEMWAVRNFGGKIRAGEGLWTRLFSSRNRSQYDRNPLAFRLSDKELVLYRFQRELGKSHLYALQLARQHAKQGDKLNLKKEKPSECN